ncbi:uncharacterized protein LOC105837084 [Monomorium pharaonis]|uniref:uncharacterized protein LOC105837084 n=1 Tax=Monomorium pharaonis TaxID=307658 RepID=UPI001745C4B0|nr:uncharacterized protein LOC105837084 [Monomorium pharaonis]XP_028048497.2 uncharacterized protein LOC105837084 [Monomorium pharaonis]XP_036142623.1 uncharacterized protein LOC105837084 [Monomorium pharaonis]
MDRSVCEIKINATLDPVKLDHLWIRRAPPQKQVAFLESVGELASEVLAGKTHRVSLNKQMRPCSRNDPDNRSQFLVLSVLQLRLCALPPHYFGRRIGRWESASEGGILCYFMKSLKPLREKKMSREARNETKNQSPIYLPRSLFLLENITCSHYRACSDQFFSMRTRGKRKRENNE